MPLFLKRIILLCCFLLSQSVHTAPAFQIVALGVNGGLVDGNLSSYLLKPIHEDNYVALDAGTLVQGLLKAFAPSVNIGDILAHHIPAYLISHAHLDHLMGFVMAQPELCNKQVLMAREETMRVLQSKVFNWEIWGNFGDKGVKPQLNCQHYQTIPLHQWIPIPDTKLSVKAFPLSHGNGFLSTAFLINYKKEYLLYFGDTGADTLEKGHALQDIWTEIAPIIRKKQLHAILLECSYTNAQPKARLFGHLKPSLYIEALHQLANTVNPRTPKDALKGLTVFVTHVKPTLNTINSTITAQTVVTEIQKGNDMGVDFILPNQGKKYTV
ncbi:MAG: 3',5'-cyclic-nucleotide phosphodiesterase [Legionella sp.]|nr:3',5'-cyclic-nucleotide phosphodiesterase [Legionella sp.]